MVKNSSGQPMPRILLVSSLLAGFLASSLHAAGKNFIVPTDPASGVKIEIESWLDACPPAGMASFALRINNGSGDAHEWTLTVADGYNGGMTTTIAVSVPAGRTEVVPFTAAAGLRAAGSGPYRLMVLTVNGHGSRGSAGQLQQPDALSRAVHATVTPFLAMSSELALKGWSTLADKFDKTPRGKGGGGIGFDATQVDIAKAPDDWRGYSGLSQLWMTDGEWSAMGAGAKAALLEWIALGGRMVLFTGNDSDARLAGLKVPPPDASGGRRIGAGGIQTQKWDGNVFPLEEAFALATNRPGDSVPKQLMKYTSGSSWKLSDSVAAPSLRALLIFGFIVGFGILVGPVNLYWFAGPKRRQRLFWTTPLISLAGSALLVALMILQDGIGGSGARRVLAVMLPEQNKLAIVQEQVSRTGVLLGRSFAIEEPSWMQQVAAESNGGTFNPSRNSDRKFRELNQRQRSGDWFSNRAVQAQVIEAVRPSRGHIEVSPGSKDNDPPGVLSSLGVTLAKVFVLDDRKRYWRAEQVGTGEKKAMQPSTEDEFKRWLQTAALDDLGAVSGDVLGALDNLAGHAYAESADTAAFAVKTLASIRWSDDRVIFAGPYVRR
jgi:hypothetical protein